MSENHFLDYVKAALYLWMMIPLTIIGTLLQPVWSLMWMLTDKILWRLVGRSFIYNVSWEDPRIDHKVFKLKEDDRVVTLCSAGDNALDYVIEGCHVTAVDLNSCQIALAELKSLAIQHLEYEEVFRIFGVNDIRLLRKVYFGTLRKHMSEVGREFWDSYVYRIRNFQYAGSSGKLAYFIFRVLFPILGLGWLRKAILEKVSREEFQALCRKKDMTIRVICHVAENYLMKACSSFAGVPKSQLQLGLHRPDNAQHVFDNVLQGTDIVHDNYFFAGYLLGYYTRENCPRYLQQKHFAALKNNLKAGKLALFHGSLLDLLKDKPKVGEGGDLFTVASLLDHMDWMPASMINEEIACLVEHMDPQKGRIFWRTFSEVVHSLPLIWLNPQRVDDRGDRVPMYFSTWISHLKDQKRTIVHRVPNLHARWSNQSLFSKLLTGAKIVSFPIVHRIHQHLPALLGTTASASSGASPAEGDSSGDNNNSVQAQAHDHQSVMEAFYQTQKEGYDAFRENMLHARPLMMTYFPILKPDPVTGKGRMVWVDVGGGTARNLEYLNPTDVRKHFARIVIVDISPSLLSIAEKRIKELGLDDIVETHCCDFTRLDDSDLRRLPKNGTADVVTLSYSLSMIPDKQAAVRNSVNLLKEKGEGFLLLADFVQRGKRHTSMPIYKRLVRRLETAFHVWWFKQDNVHLLSAPDTRLVTSRMETQWDWRFRGSVPFLPFMRPYHGVLVAHTR